MNRKRLPDLRDSITHKTVIDGNKLYITVGLYDDGTPGELFLDIGKEGGALKVYNLLATAISIGLQYGVPLSAFVDKFKHQQMVPRGLTSNADIPIAKSLIDYTARWLEIKFSDAIDREEE